MNFRLKTIVLLFLACACGSGVLHAEEKWNLLLANWEELSPSVDPGLGFIIKKSLKTWLDQVPYFSVKAGPDTLVLREDTQSARLAGISNMCDVIVYGSYYVEGDSIAVVTEVYDILKGELKMRKVYRGVVTVDVFDTIDTIIKDLLVKIREVLPKMRLENEVEIKNIRRTLFEKESIKLKRLFYTRVGARGEFGPKQFAGSVYYPSTGWMATNYNETFSTASLAAGIMLRYWDLRLDGLLSPLPGLPPYDFGFNRFYMAKDVPNYSYLFLSYYLPFFDGRWAVGLGLQAYKIPGSIDNNDSSSNNYYVLVETLGPQILALNVVWNPTDELEFSLSANVVPQFRSDYLEPNNYIYWNLAEFLLPPVRLNGIWFFGGFIGAELNIAASYGRYLQGGVYTNVTSTNRETSAFMLDVYAGLVYRVNFLDSGK